MLKALDDTVDREEAIVSVPESKRITRDFGRQIILDLSTPELEYAKHMMPTERLFNPTSWLLAYLGYWQGGGGEHPSNNIIAFWERFNQAIVSTFNEYQLPVIELGQETPKEAVCTVFEKVNTGGVTLSVFELVTATFAADDFALRDDWDARRKRIRQEFSVLRGIQGEQFLQAVTLVATQQRRRWKIKEGASANQAPRIACQKRDVLNLNLDEYNTWADKVEDGFRQAAKFLHRQFVFKQWDVPYNTQLIPLAALFVDLGSELEPANANVLLEQWYWSGIFSEVYGSAVETQYALDLEQVARYVRTGTPPQLITEANFNPERLISLRTRNSAAYKGLYALLMKSGAADWLSDKPLTSQTHHDEAIDIHHTFPVAWCEKTAEPPIPPELYNSIINKTPIAAHTNRIIGGRAPSTYYPMLRKLNAGLDRALYAHWLNPEWLAEDAFDECFMKRGAEMLTLIGEAMGKEFTGGNGVFQNALIRAGLRPADQQHPLDLPEPQQFDDPDNDDDPLDEPVNDTDAAA